MRANAYFLEYIDAFYQSACYFTTLVGDTLTLEAFAFGFSFSFFNDEDTLCITFILSGYFFAFGGIDAVHRCFYLGIGVDIGNQSFDDVVTISFHRLLNFAFNGDSDVVFLHEYIVQFHFRYFGTNHVEHIAGNLIVRVFELIDGIVYLFFDNDELHRHFDFYEYII